MLSPGEDLEGAEAGSHDVTGEDGRQEERGGPGTATNGGREREETTGTRKRKGHKNVYLPNNVIYIQQKSNTSITNTDKVNLLLQSISL